MLPKTRYARRDDVCIAYQVTGDGPVDVVMAPGTMSHLDMDWEIPNRAQFFERFGRICRLVRFDERGTGLSDRPIAMATLEQRTDDSQAGEGERVRAMPRRIRPRAGVSIAGRIRPVVWRSNMANPAGVA